MIHRLYKKLDKLIIVIVTILAILAGLIHFAYANMLATEDGLGRPFAKYWVNWESILTDDVQVIGCIRNLTPNSYKGTFVTYEPINGVCSLPHSQNIMLPKLNDIYIWKKYRNDSSLINRLPIVNFESSFRECAGDKGCYGLPYNPIAKGYVQTLRKWNISTEVDPQLQWMAKRMKSQVVGNCSQWVEHGEERLLRCLASRHYGNKVSYQDYDNKVILARTYYINYLTKYKH